MTPTYHSYQSPGGTVHLSRNHRYTLCGWNIRAGWTETSSTHSNTCHVCKRIRAAELAVATKEAPAETEGTTP